MHDRQIMSPIVDRLSWPIMRTVDDTTWSQTICRFAAKIQLVDKSGTATRLNNLDYILT